MIKTITEIGYLPDVALVTVNNIPNTPQNLSKIMNEISDRHVTQRDTKNHLWVLLHKLPAGSLPGERLYLKKF